MSNEITVKMTCSLQEMYNILKEKGFKIADKYELEDIYYIRNDLNVNKHDVKEILKKYMLIRKVKQYIPNDFIDSYDIIKVTLKSKEISSNGTIINQTKTDCEVKNESQATKLIEMLGYKELMTIKEKGIVYKKNNLELGIKDIESIGNLIEVETIENDKELDTIDKLKLKLNELKLPIDENNYFVKKAEIALENLKKTADFIY